MRPPRRKILGRSLLTCLLLISCLVAPAVAQIVLPDVEMVLVIEIPDPVDWLGFHEEVLRTPRDSPKPLLVSVAAATGGNRSILVFQPGFAADFSSIPGRRALRVTVTGRIGGADALRTLGGFEAAVAALVSGAMPNQLVLVYGLAEIKAQMRDLKLARP